MPQVSTGTTSIAFGSTLRIGYRPAGSLSAFTYITPYQVFNDLPKTFELATGTWEVELTEICPNCSTGNYSTPVITLVTVLS